MKLNVSCCEVVSVYFYSYSLLRWCSTKSGLNKCSKCWFAVASFLYCIFPLQISHFATCACLSNRNEYPTFFRTIPSDYYQSRALAKLVMYFGWTWIGAIASDNEYGLTGISAFIQAARELGVCIEYSESFVSTDPPDSLQRIVRIIKHSTSKVIMAFMSHREITLLATELFRQNVTDLQWVGSDAWITDPSLVDSEGHSILVGSLGFVVSNAVIPGLEDHLRLLHPSQFPNSQFVRDFWEHTFDCSLNGTAETRRKPCSGSESLQADQSYFTDVSELRFINNVYKAVYAVAFALHNLLKCKEGDAPSYNGNCAAPENIEPGQVRKHQLCITHWQQLESVVSSQYVCFCF